LGNPCNNVQAVGFIAKYRPDSQILATLLDVPVENIIGLAAFESEYGRGRFADQGNNFFSMHAPSHDQTGTLTAAGDPKMKVSTFKDFLSSGKSFAHRFGAGVRGRKDPDEFGRALVTSGFNTGSSKNGGRDGYAKEVADIIRMVKARITCLP
jgi:hypothetical protein